jgi:hypothetical protein
MNSSNAGVLEWAGDYPAARDYLAADLASRRDRIATEPAAARGLRAMLAKAAAGDLKAQGMMIMAWAIKRAADDGEFPTLDGCDGRPCAWLASIFVAGGGVRRPLHSDHHAVYSAAALGVAAAALLPRDGRPLQGRIVLTPEQDINGKDRR